MHQLHLLDLNTESELICLASLQQTAFSVSPIDDFGLIYWCKGYKHEGKNSCSKLSILKGFIYCFNLDVPNSGDHQLLFGIS